MWAGNESSPGVRADWVVYGKQIWTVMALAVKSFRKSCGKGRKFSDYTVNVEPLRADEEILAAVK